jgi:membrane protein implicated in regulation of membrane protease activity
VRGEIWSARCDPARTLASGQTVRVRAVTGLVLEVEPAPEADANPKE